DGDFAGVGVAHADLDAAQAREVLHDLRVAGAEAGQQEGDIAGTCEDVLQLEALAAEAWVVGLVVLQGAGEGADVLGVAAQVHVLRVGEEVLAQARQLLAVAAAQQEGGVADRPGGQRDAPGGEGALHVGFEVGVLAEVAAALRGVVGAAAGGGGDAVGVLGDGACFGAVDEVEAVLFRCWQGGDGGGLLGVDAAAAEAFHAAVAVLEAAVGLAAAQWGVSVAVGVEALGEVLGVAVAPLFGHILEDHVSLGPIVVVGEVVLVEPGDAGLVAPGGE